MRCATSLDTILSMAIARARREPEKRDKDDAADESEAPEVLAQARGPTDRIHPEDSHRGHRGEQYGALRWDAAHLAPARSTCDRQVRNSKMPQANRSGPSSVAFSVALLASFSRRSHSSFETVHSSNTLPPIFTFGCQGDEGSIPPEGFASPAAALQNARTSRRSVVVAPLKNPTQSRMRPTADARRHALRH